MQHPKGLISLLFAAATLTALASPAQAVETITITGPSGTFGNDQVMCSGSLTTCPFVSIFSFLTPIGHNQVNGAIVTSASPTSNIDFTSVFLRTSPTAATR